MKRPLLLLCAVFLAARFLTACTTVSSEVVEEAADPKSPARKIAAYHLHKWISRPITAFEKSFDLNKNGILDPDELMRFNMARGFYHSYGNVWKYDKNKDWQLDQEEYYDASGGDQQ